MTNNFPKDKYVTTIKIGPKGQIIIPKEVREMFGYNPGDVILLMADKNQGVGIIPFNAEIWDLLSGEKS